MKKYILPSLIILVILNVQIAFGQVPTITSFSPTSGFVGTPVVITGTGFSATATSNIVYFGAVKATVSSSTTTTLNVTVPFGATYQPITVMVNGLLKASSKPFVVTFPSLGGISASSFSLKVDLPSNNAGNSVALSDLDGDGKSDLIMADYNTSNPVSLFLNKSSAGSITVSSFGSEAVLTSGANPYSVAVGDLDGDGKQDLAVTNYFTNHTVSIFRNVSTLGAITFSSPRADLPLSPNTNPGSVSISDLDGDGKLDLIVTNNGSSNFSVFRNIALSGSLTVSSFVAKQDFICNAGPTSSAIADVDGDGKPDLVMTNQTGATASVFRNTSTPGVISFAIKVDLLTGTTPVKVAIGDLDGDGLPDLAVANNGAASISIFRNTSTVGLPSFLPKVDLPTTSNTLPSSVAIGDLDGDGKPEIVATNNGSANVSVWRNVAVSGTLVLASFPTKFDFQTGTQPNAVAIGDLDNDGRADLAVANFAGTALSVFRNQTTPIQPPVITSFSPQSGAAGSSVNINGSNFNTTAANNIVYFGAAKATVTFASTNLLTVTVPPGATVQPITVTSNGLTGYSAKHFDVTFPQSGVLDINSFAATVNYTTGSAPYRVLLSDLDGDGKSDLISVNRDANSVSIYKNNTASPGTFTAGSFTAGVDLVAGPAASDAAYGGAVGDLDGDGRPDIVVTSATQNTLTVFKNTSSVGLISFSSGVIFPTGTNPFGVAITDLDLDGKPDVVVANKLDGTLSVFKNTFSVGINTNSLASAFTLNVGSHPLNLAVGDLNSDGLPDLAVANYNDNGVSVIRNHSTPGVLAQSSFDSKVDYPTGVGPEGIVLADLSGSGKLDIAVSNQSENTVSVLKNNSTAAVAFTQTSFVGKVDFLNAIDPLSLAVGDLDGDGKIDLIDDGDNTISFIKNITTTGSITQGSFAQHVDMTGTPWNIAIGDLDGDGKPEIAGAFLGSNAIAISRNVAATGFVKPIASPTNLAFSNVTSASLTGSFTAASGSPTGYIVFRKVGSAIATAIPVDGTTYAVNAALGDGTVAYVGSGVSWNDISLAASAQYFYTIFPYNGSGTSISYLTTTPLTGSQLLPASGSLAVEPTAQPTNLVFSNVATTSYSFAFNAATGSPDGYVIVVNVGSAPTGYPVDGVVYTTFPTSLTNGTGLVNNVGSPTSYNYSGAGSGVSVFFAIYAYRGSGASINYYTISPLTGNVTTLTGAALATAPTAQPSGLFFSSITNTSYTVSYNAASVTPAGYIALRKAGSAPSSGIPIGGTTYAVGAKIGDATVAFVGTGLNFSESGLTPATTYYYTLYSYNGSTTSINYLTTSPATGNVTTGFLQPTIISFTPTHGYVGSLVTVSGINFSPSSANDVVDFNGTTATTITNATTTSFTATVPSGATDGPITITLGGTLSSTSALDFTVDVPPLSLVDSSFVSSYARDITNTVSVTVNDVTFASSANLWTKGITASGPYTSRVIPLTADIISTSLTASEMADPIGVHYYFEVIPIDLSASLTTDTTVAFLSNPSTATDPPVISGLSIGKTAASYQIIAVPYTLSPNNTSSVFTALGGVDNTKWRLWAYDKNATPIPYDENPSSIVPGQGYWLIDNVTGTANINVGSGKVVQATEQSPFFIQLNAGYNLIGNPYNFNILWQDVLDFNPSIPATTQLRLFNNNDTNPGFNNGTVLPKFRGGFVNSTSSVKLYFPVTRNPSAGRIGNVEFAQNSIDQPQWALNLRLGNAEYSNNLAGIGMNPQATVKGMDVFDQLSLPFPDETSFFEVAFDHPEINKTFDTEVVPTGSSYTWDFEVRRGISAGQVTMSWRNDYFGNSDRQLVLFDPSTMQFIDMRQENQYVLRESTKRLKIIFGSKDYVNSTLDRDLPLIGTVYPNPAQQRVVIPFRVPLSLDRADVNITIYDDHGRAISTIVNGEYQKGRYEAIWNPEGPAGLYYLQFKLGTNNPESQKIVIIR